MSVQYHRDIFSNERLILKINFFGLRDDIANAEDLSMSIYAYERVTGEPVFRETLNYSQVKSLYEHLNQISIIKDSASPLSGRFVESTGEINHLLDRFQTLHPDTLKIILGKLSEEDKISGLLEFLSENEIDSLILSKKEQVWKLEIENLKKLLFLEENGNIVEGIKKEDSLAKYRGGQPEKIFQNWIELNYKWIFGIEYLKKHDVRQIALTSEGDLLMESIDGYLDLVELKRPSHSIFGPIDSSHKSYYPSSDLSKVMGQALLYLQKMDDMKLILEKDYKVKIIRPRIKIIIGRTIDFNDDQFNALRMLNCQLMHLEIISYDSLIKFGERMINHLREEE